MTNRRTEILEELKSVVSGKTLDALIPPLIFVVTNSFLELRPAIALAMGTALLLSLIRLIRRQPLKYALGGLGGVTLASAFALFAGRAENYFIPKILGSAFMVLLSLVSLIAGKPLAAWTSHLSRAWPVDWYWRRDVLPAYREVTWLWTGLFVMRLAIQILLYLRGSAAQLAWANLLLGTPVTLGVLVVSYLYGQKRLHQLGGPGVREFTEGASPPWEGQTRGF